MKSSNNCLNPPLSLYMDSSSGKKFSVKPGLSIDINSQKSTTQSAERKKPNDDQSDEDAWVW